MRVDPVAPPVPDIAKVKNDELGELIKYGRALTAETYKYLGPEAARPEMRFAGDNPACRSRHLNAAGFIRNNMPLGATHREPGVSDEDAYDVAAFIVGRPRPHMADLDKDFPNRLRKPVDMPFPPFVDEFSAERHKFGPFDPIRARMKESQRTGR